MAGLPKKEAGLTTPLRRETTQPSILGEVYVPEGRIDRALGMATVRLELNFERNGR